MKSCQLDLSTCDIGQGSASAECDGRAQGPGQLRSTEGASGPQRQHHQQGEGPQEEPQYDQIPARRHGQEVHVHEAEAGW